MPLSRALERLKAWLRPARAPETRPVEESPVDTPASPRGDVLIIQESTDPKALAEYVQGKGPLPPGARSVPFDEYAALRRALDCDCNLIQCVCHEARQHKPDCHLRIALMCAIPFPCDAHGLDVCPTCDVCTCNVATGEPGALTPDATDTNEVPVP